MELSDFRHVDCSLLRTPLIENSKLAETVDEALVNAWKDGVSIDQAVNGILEDEKVVDDIAKQIAKSMDFQREQELKKAERDALKRKEEHMQAFRRQVDDVEKQIGVSVVQREEELKQARDSYVNASGSYNATQQSLEQMRERVKNALQEIDERKYADLVDINTMITGEDSAGSRVSTATPKDKQVGGRVYSPLDPELSKTIHTVKTNQKIDPLNNKPDVKYVDLSKKSGGGRISRALRKTWEVLNYNVWPRRK